MKMRNQAAVDAANRKTRAKEFQAQQLAKKTEREDQRRLMDITLKKTLKQQRMMNATSVKLRRNKLKEDIMIANKNNDVEKLQKLVQELEMAPSNETKNPTALVSPISKKSGKINVMMSPKRVGSSIAKSINANCTAMKASIYRES